MIEPKEIHILDCNSKTHGVPAKQLMENAGKSVSDYITETLKLTNKKILLLIGPGNNGGDGLVAARYLNKENNLAIQLSCQPDDIKTQIAKDNYKSLPPNIVIRTSDQLEELPSLIDNADIIIDALLGIGLSGELKEPYKSIVATINSNKKHKPVIAVDIPTGHGTDTRIIATHTITFHDKKTGMNHTSCGTIHVADIGIPKKAQTHLGPGDLQVLYPKPKSDSHKGDNGRVFIIGGGPYNGAPLLSGLASLRSGADLITIASPKRTYDAIKSYSPDLICIDLISSTHLCKEDIATLEPYIKANHAILLGPGLGSHQQTQEALKSLIPKILEEDKTLIIDADAIQTLGELLRNGAIDFDHKGSITVTPHHNEYKKLTGKKLSEELESQTEELISFAQKHCLSILLKGPTDILTNGDTHKYNTIHNPAMTVGGTGDVLAGIIAALQSKNCTAFESIRIAAYLNGSAGNLAFEHNSYGMSAIDVLEKIPQVLKEHL